MKVIQAFYMTLPVILAGLFFIFCLKKGLLKPLERPLDFGATFCNKPIFGPNKTWLGVIMMPTGTLFFTVILTVFSALLQPAVPIPSYDLSPTGLLKSFLLGAAYSLGELPNSFIKRQLNIPAGEQAQKPFLRFLFFIIDLLDSVFAASLAAYFLYPIDVYVSLLMLFIGFAVHLSTDFLMKHLGLK